MSEDADRIRQQMQHVRQEMGAGMHDVVHGARQLSDWKYYVRRHPWLCVGSAFALGFLATPARRKLVTGSVDVAKVIAQLKHHGVDAAALSGGMAGGGGLAGRAFNMLWPIVLQNAGAMLAQHFANREHAAPVEPTATEEIGGP